MLQIQLRRFTFTFGLTKRTANIADPVPALPVKGQQGQSTVLVLVKNEEKESARPWIEDCDKRLESITKQAIFSKLKKWIMHGTVYPSVLFEIRNITHELLTGKKKTISQNLADVPVELDRARDLRFSEFLPEERRRILLAALKFVGIDNSNGSSTIGEEYWNEIKQLVEKVSCQS